MPECCMRDPFPLDQLKEIAGEIQGIDLTCYAMHDKDPTAPILGLGKANARWCFFGRDPGDKEVEEQKLLVGDSGQRIRSVLNDFDLDDKHIFWMNTVPFKPKDNKKWPMGVVRKCHPILLDLLANWQGSDVITFGVQALEWFGLSSPENRRSIAFFQKRSDKFTSQFPVVLSIKGVERSFNLHPVPHPSSLNRKWSSQFRHLLKARLQHAHTSLDAEQHQERLGCGI